MSDVLFGVSKGTVSFRVTVLRLLVANKEFWATGILIRHVLLQECILVVFQDLQALQRDLVNNCFPFNIIIIYSQSVVVTCSSLHPG